MLSQAISALSMKNKKNFDFVIQVAEAEPNHVVDMELAIAEYIKKRVAFFLNYILPYPNRIKFNPTTRRFYAQQGSRLRKAMCIIWYVLVCVRLILKTVPNSKDSPGGQSSPIMSSANIVFVCYCTCTFFVLWVKANNLLEILNESIDLSPLLAVKFVDPPKSLTEYNLLHIFWIGTFGFAFGTHLIEGIIKLVTNSYGKSLLHPYDSLAFPFPFPLDSIDLVFSIPVQVLTLLANFLNTFTWTTSFFYVGIWSFLFRQLFKVYLWRMGAISSCNTETFNFPDEIRTFNTIGHLVDKWNDVFGASMVLGAISVILYFSISVENLVRDSASLTGFVSKSALLLSYTPLLSGVLMVSEVHRMAVSISKVIKHQFEKCKGSRATDRYMMESLHAMSIVHHDVVMNNVGIKGFGFFTMSHQVVLTMMSVVITYAIVAVQMFPDLKDGEAKQFI